MLLTVKNLSKQYRLQKGIFSNKTETINALEGVHFELGESTVLGVLGETGSGKTTLAKLLVGLLKPTQGEIKYVSNNLPRIVQMVFQNPYSSLNPRLRIKTTLKEPFTIHGLATKKDIEIKIREVLKKVNMNPNCLNRFPDEFSGGQRQRIAIARAISAQPKILICDEPTASLDLSVQAQILNLFLKLKSELGLSYLFISHNIEVISFIADEVLILYAGRVVERGTKTEVLHNPQHPYTKLLLHYNLKTTPQSVKDECGSGCAFYQHCPLQSTQCKTTQPHEVLIEKNHYVACHRSR